MFALRMPPQFPGDIALDRLDPLDVVAPPPDPLMITDDHRTVSGIVRAVLSSAIDRFGARVQLNDFINFSHQDVMRVASTPGVFIVTSPPQTDKSMYMGTAAVLSQRIVGKPSALITADKKLNILELVGKLGFTSPLGVEFVRVTTDADIRRLTARTADVLLGRIVPVVQASAPQLARLKDFFLRIRAADVTIFSDEPDAMWTNHPDSRDRTGREIELRALFSMAGDFMGRTSMVRKWVLVSATHMSDLWICDVLGCQPVSISACAAKLTARGYAGKDEIIPWRKWLNMSNHTKVGLYCFMDAEVQEFLQEFAADPRDMRMLLMAITPQVTVVAGAFEVAGLLVKKFPGFFVVVKSAEGLRRFQVVEDAVHSTLVGGTLQEVVNRLDATPAGRATPVVEVAYELSMRGASERSDRRVISHMIVALTAGRSTAEILQVFLRCGGKTVQLRRENGFAGVSMLTGQPEYAGFMGLDDLTVAAAANTPDFPGGEYAHELRAVVGSKRPHVRKPLKLDFKRARFAAPLVADAVEPAAAAEPIIVAAVVPAAAEPVARFQYEKVLVFIYNLVGTTGRVFKTEELKACPTLGASNRRCLRRELKLKYSFVVQLDRSQYQLTPQGVARALQLLGQ